MNYSDYIRAYAQSAANAARSFAGLLGRFFQHLTASERTGFYIYILTAFVVAALLSSCTPETYVEDLEPETVDVVIQAGPSVFEDFEQNTEYDLNTYCEGEAPTLSKVTFEEDGTCVVCTVPAPGEFGTCWVYTFTEQDGVLFVYDGRDVIMSLQNTSPGLLTGANFATGCAVVIR